MPLNKIFPFSLRVPKLGKRNKYLYGKKGKQPNGGERMRTNVFPYWIGLWVVAIILVLAFGH
jgi:hypothetical protein